MTLLDAPSYDPARARVIRNGIIALVVAGLVLGVFLYIFWNWPEEHRVNQFFAAVEKGDFPAAFGVWNNDPDWQQHPGRYTDYPYGRFLLDWSKSGDYGLITSHKILYATSSLGNSVLMAIQINGRPKPLALAVTKKTHTLGFTPFEITPQKNALGMTYWQVSYQ